MPSDVNYGPEDWANWLEWHYSNEGYDITDINFQAYLSDVSHYLTNLFESSGFYATPSSLSSAGYLDELWETIEYFEETSPGFGFLTPPEASSEEPEDPDDPEEIEWNMSALDFDGDGQLTSEDYFTAIEEGVPEDLLNDFENILESNGIIQNQPHMWDVNQDGVVSVHDLIVMAEQGWDDTQIKAVLAYIAAFEEAGGDESLIGPISQNDWDLNQDGIVDDQDLELMAEQGWDDAQIWGVMNYLDAGGNTVVQEGDYVVNPGYGNIPATIGGQNILDIYEQIQTGVYDASTLGFDMNMDGVVNQDDIDILNSLGYDTSTIQSGYDNLQNMTGSDNFNVSDFYNSGVWEEEAELETPHGYELNEDWGEQFAQYDFNNDGILDILDTNYIGNLGAFADTDSPEWQEFIDGFWNAIDHITNNPEDASAFTEVVGELEVPPDFAPPVEDVPGTLPEIEPEFLEADYNNDGVVDIFDEVLLNRIPPGYSFEYLQDRNEYVLVNPTGEYVDDYSEVLQPPSEEGFEWEWIEGPEGEGIWDLVQTEFPAEEPGEESEIVNWLNQYDLNDDGIVDIFDINLIPEDWTTTQIDDMLGVIQGAIPSYLGGGTWNYDLPMSALQSAPEGYMWVQNNIGEWVLTLDYLDFGAATGEMGEGNEGIYDPGEEFIDENGNGVWDEGEEFTDSDYVPVTPPTLEGVLGTAEFINPDEPLPNISQEGWNWEFDPETAQWQNVSEEETDYTEETVGPEGVQYGATPWYEGYESGFEGWYQLPYQSQQMVQQVFGDLEDWGYGPGASLWDIINPYEAESVEQAIAYSLGYREDLTLEEYVTQIQEEYPDLTFGQAMDFAQGDPIANFMNPDYDIPNYQDFLEGAGAGAREYLEGLGGWNPAAVATMNPDMIDRLSLAHYDPMLEGARSGAVAEALGTYGGGIGTALDAAAYEEMLQQQIQASIMSPYQQAQQSQQAALGDIMGVVDEWGQLIAGLGGGGE